MKHQEFHAFVGKRGNPCDYVMTEEDKLPCARGQEANIHQVHRRVLDAPSHSATPATEAFVAHSDAVLEIVRKKDAAYGGAWQRQGYMGNLARIMSKTERLKNMMWRDDALSDDLPEGHDESVMDTLHDLMALAAFMASNLEEGNRWGR